VPDTALDRGILAIYHKPPEVPYCYYKLVINVIIAVKIIVILMVYGLIYHGCKPISIQGSNHPVYNGGIYNEINVYFSPCKVQYKMSKRPSWSVCWDTREKGAICVRMPTPLLLVQ
jgi:hypothetical protein